MTPATTGLAVALGFAAAAALAACRVPNKEHCANQDQPGNDYCVSLNPATPFCSPCHANNHGCVPFVPTACEAYATGSSETGGSSAGEGSSDDGPATSGPNTSG